MFPLKSILSFYFFALFLLGCSEPKFDNSLPTLTLNPAFSSRLDIYQEVLLTSDLSSFSDNQKQMLRVLIEASRVVDDIYWLQTFNENKQQFLARINDPKVQHFARINYGSWDRLNNDIPFLNGISEKNIGAAFYPKDMTKAEFEASSLPDKSSLYSVIQRDSNQQLTSVFYSEIYGEQLNRVALLLEKAASLAKDADFAHYLLLRAEALRTDQYQASDLAWMDMKNNVIDIVIGPIETYEDQLFGYKAAFESFVLIKDLNWSKKLLKYTKELDSLQKALPIAKKYKKEMPGSNADLNVYDVIYAAGDANSGSKTIAINLPNDEEVQLTKGTRRLQLKNTMQAKFKSILLPIAEQLIAPEQRKYITFNAFFNNTMFHEIAHGLGIKKVYKSNITVREALKDQYSALEEGKADVLGLFMIHNLLNKKVLPEGALVEYYTTFMTSIFRSIRFGTNSAHGKANMIRFNYFLEQEAFSRSSEGFYQVNEKNMTTAVNKLSSEILMLQAKGDYEAAAAFTQKYSQVNQQLQADLNKLSKANIPVDISFKQGKEVLGL